MEAKNLCLNFDSACACAYLWRALAALSRCADESCACVRASARSSKTQPTQCEPVRQFVRLFSSLRCRLANAEPSTGASHSRTQRSAGRARCCCCAHATLALLVVLRVRCCQRQRRCPPPRTQLATRKPGGLGRPEVQAFERPSATPPARGSRPTHAQAPHRSRPTQSARSSEFAFASKRHAAPARECYKALRRQASSPMVPPPPPLHRLYLYLCSLDTREPCCCVRGGPTRPLGCAHQIEMRRTRPRAAARRTVALLACVGSFLGRCGRKTMRRSLCVAATVATANIHRHSSTSDLTPTLVDFINVRLTSRRACDFVLSR